MEQDDLSAWLRLTLTPHVGNATARKLLAAFAAPAAIFSQSQSALLQVVSFAPATALGQIPGDLQPLLEATLSWLKLSQDDGVQRHVAALGDPLYPASLLDIEDPPLLLYLMGRTDLSHHCAQSIAIVGSRNPTPQGAANARQFAKSLQAAGLTIVSGLALGVDGAAHEGALENTAGDLETMATIAVVGTGLDRVYPKAHLSLAHKIAKRGLLLSEYPIGTPPVAANFPRRNRLISGLSSATLVVEAALQSGSLITARMAAEQGKDVFAIPGSIHSTQSRGCHALIRQGAKLIESAQDVLEEMRLPGHSVASSSPPPAGEEVDNPDNALLTALGFDPVSLEALQARTGLDTARLQAGLMALELDGWVTRLPGGLFQRMGTA